MLKIQKERGEMHEFVNLMKTFSTDRRQVNASLKAQVEQVMH